MQKNKFYKDFGKYFEDQWVKYFKDKSLVLRNIHKKVRTNNSLENFNRIYKHTYEMKSNMNLIKYIDNLLELAKDQINLYKNQLNTQQKNILEMI